MTTVDLAGVHAKIGRAKHHLTELKKAIGERFNPNSHHFTFEFDGDSGRYASIVHDLPGVDPDWPLIVGEIAFHLRSALDHLAYQIVRFDGGSPDKHTQYPIFESPNNEKGEPRKSLIRPPVRNPSLIQALKDTQPYTAVNGEVDVAAGLRHPLLALARLNNIDKHRLLLTAAAALDAGQMYWGLPENFPSPQVWLNTGVLQDHRPVAWFDFGEHDPPPHFDPHPSLHVTLREREVWFISTTDMCDFLAALCEFWVTEHIVGWRFEPIFRGDSPLSTRTEF